MYAVLTMLAPPGAPVSSVCQLPQLGPALRDFMDTATIMGTEAIVEVHTPAVSSPPAPLHLGIVGMRGSMIVQLRLSMN